MIEALITMTYIAGYSLVGGFTGLLCWKTFVPKRPFADTPIPVFAGAFWPVGLPLAFPFLLYYWTKKAIALQSKRPATIRVENKVQDYAASPVKILTEIICAKITKEPERIKRTGTNYHAANYGWSSSDETVSITFKVGNDSGHCANWEVWVNNNLQSVDSELLTLAVKAAMKHNAAKAKADADADRQLKALEAVESLLLTPVKKEEV